MINVNLMGTFHFIKASLPRMRRIGRTVDQHRRPLYHRRPIRWEFMVTRLTRLASLASGDWSKHCNRRSSQTTFMSRLYFLQKQKLEGNEIWLAIVVGSIIGFFGAAFGIAGGVGGGGIFVTMLSLVIGFDPKSATTMSKCMIMGAAGSTIYYNLKLRHPTLDMPIIDYDLVLLFQPMLMMGISIVVAFNVVFADWMVAILLIVLFLGTSTMTFLKGVETWKKETIMKKILKTVQEGS